MTDYLFRPEFGLYDIMNDPSETQNLAAEIKYSTMLDSLKQKIKLFQLKTADPWMILWDNDASLQGTGVNL